jgi:hypothetical protein
MAQQGVLGGGRDGASSRGSVTTSMMLGGDVCLAMLVWTSGLPFGNLRMEAPETGVAGPTNTRQRALTGGDDHGKRPPR